MATAREPRAQLQLGSEDGEDGEFFCECSDTCIETIQLTLREYAV